MPELITKKWIIGGWVDINLHVEGEPRFLVHAVVEGFSGPDVIIVGTDHVKINKFKEILDWHWPYDLENELEFVYDAAKHVDAYYKKIQSIQSFPTLKERIEKNHIDIREDGVFTFRKRPITFEDIGIVRAEHRKFEGRLNEKGEEDILVISDGKDELAYFYDDHWAYSYWEKLS